MATERKQMITLGPTIGGVLLAGLLVNPVPSSQVVATGLDNPRGLASGADGTLYVAEAGRGGPCVPERRGGHICAGPTGAITAIRNGQVRRIVTGLPSQASPAGAEAVGPSDVSVDDGGTPQYTTGPGALVADGRSRIVVSPGGGALQRLGIRGRAGTIASFADHGTTSVTRGPDGALYTGGGTGVRRLPPHGNPEPYAAGPPVTDLAWSSDGHLYVLESSALIRVGPRRTRQVIIAGLRFPGGLTIQGHAAYVTTCSICRATGSVLRIKIP
ncbi:ScyD/ScyE family protein [Actinoplanes sp. NPDC020271]|uniref:ScyD/ScyE family protein n=1 Tax=Actinoplanes sp. NPDC020271 TaxID=3363896 RepID=UPI003788E6D0